LRNLNTLISKEFQLEFRRKAVISGLGLYLISTVFICYITFSLRHEQISPLVWSALFWITLLFTSIQAIAKSFIGERQGRSIYYYSIASPSSIILSKIIYNFLLAAVVSLVGYLMFSLFIGNPVSDTFLFIVTIILVSMGFAATLTLISAVAAKTSSGHILMAVLSFPIIISILMIGIKLTKNCVDGLDRSVSTHELIILASINCIVTAVSYLLFPYIWRS
jgi:heme exporter protein B